MKKIIIVILSLCACSGVQAQNRSIDFRPMPWEKVLRTAGKEKRLVFVDCYTSWCGPCKTMARDVFTRDSVADFFNQHFVCVKLDMEKEGKPLAAKYHVSSYPTFLFIDPETEQMVHAFVGFREAAQLRTEGGVALDVRNNLSGLERRYEEGEREPAFMTRYLVTLKEGGKRQRCDEIMDAYFRGLNDEQVVTPEHWRLLDQQLDTQTDPLSYTYQRFMSLWKAFGRVADPVKVEFRLNMVIRNGMNRFVRWDPAEDVPFDSIGCRRLIAYLQTLDYPLVATWLAQMYTAEYLGKQDYPGMFFSMKEAVKFRFMNTDQQYFYLLLFSGHFADSKDVTLIREVTGWMDGWEKVYPEDYPLGLAKVRLLRACGEDVAAGKLEAELKREKE